MPRSSHNKPAGGRATSGKLQGANAVGTAGGGQCADTITVFLKVANDVIVAAACESTDCSAAVDCAAAMEGLIKGKHLDEAYDVTAESLLAALASPLPPEKRHVAQIAAEALENAIWDYVIQAVEEHSKTQD